MISRRRLLSLIPGIVAAPFVAGTALAQGYEPQPPVGVADNLELTKRVTLLEWQKSAILAVLRIQADEMQKIRKLLGHPGPNYPYEVRGKQT